ncbi:divergent polysaccharide deacetylase family protein [bacterium]|nr:divergent polysaccharide deacetylase family protein [bacterium]
MQIAIPPWGKRTKLHKSFSPIYLILISLAVFSILSLDYIQWRKKSVGSKPPQTEQGKSTSTDENALHTTLLQKLSQSKISSESIHTFKDKQGIYHLLIEISLKKFNHIQSFLEKELHKKGASILHQEKQITKDKTFYLWQIKGKKGERLALLFSCKKEKPIPPAKPQNKVSLIMDDMGYSLKAIYDICALKVPITVSILPYSPVAQETAHIAHQNNLEVILHLPLEAINARENDNHMKGIIHSQMKPQEIIRTVDSCLQQLPYIKGVNNHMGSKITPNPSFMRTILERLKGKNLYFIDSMTTGDSVAYRMAQSMDISSAYRQVFLDTQKDKDSIKEKLLELFRLAQKRGKAVGICHPFEETLRVLKENLPLTKRYGIKPVFASQIVE